LRRVITSLQLAAAKTIYTDRLKQYQWLIPKVLHNIKRFGTNRIERMHLTLRTHLKRLNRRSIGYSRSVALLSATVKIYFWS
ncbi:MAG: IS1 family transposase, partial [Flavobacteriaceae bacterium]